MDVPKKRSASQANLAFPPRPAKRRLSPHLAHRRSTPGASSAPLFLDLISGNLNFKMGDVISRSFEYVSQNIAPDLTVLGRRESSEGEVPGGFPVDEEEEPLPNGTNHVEEEPEVDEAPQEKTNAPSPVPTHDSPGASPGPPTRSVSRAESFSLAETRESTGFESVITSGRSSPLNGSPKKTRRKPVLQIRRHPLKKKHDLEMKMRTMRELFALKRRGGYSQDERTFRNYLSYKEHLEAFYIATDKKLPPPANLYGPDSIPPIPSSNFLYRAFKNARLTLESPRPVIPRFATSEAIARQQKERDEEIERRLRPKLPDTLPAEAEEKVQQSLSNRSFLAKAAREQVSAQDLARLRPGAWLNDEIINFYGALISERASRFEEESKKKTDEKGKGKDVVINGKGKGKDYPVEDGVGDPWKVHVFSTYFLAKLQDLGYEKAKLNKWTKKIDIFSKDVVLIPCNLGNSHWTCAAINFRDKRIEYYDSMGMDRPPIRQALRTYLAKEHQDKKSAPFNFDGWIDYFSDESPQQENGYDCGVFLCQTMENLSRGVGIPFDFGQKNMPYLRRRMVLEIANERLEVKRI